MDGWIDGWCRKFIEFDGDGKKNFLINWIGFFYFDDCHLMLSCGK